MTATTTAAEAAGHFGGAGLDLPSLILMLEALDDFVDAGAAPAASSSSTTRTPVPRTRSGRCAATTSACSWCSSPRSTAAWAAARSTPTASASGWPASTSAWRRRSSPRSWAATRSWWAAPRSRSKQWLGRIADEGILFAYGATEPEAGSDLGAMRTTAAPGRDGRHVTGYRITGRKQWISNGSIADVCTVLALAPGGPSWFVVGARHRGVHLGATRGQARHPAVQHRRALPRRRRRACRPPGGRGRGRGLVQAQQVFGYTRLMVAAFGLGGGWAALDRAIRYSTERVQGGSPLSREAGLHPQADRSPRRAAGGRPRRHRGDRRPDRRRSRCRRSPEHRGRHRQVPGDRGRQRRGRRRASRRTAATATPAPYLVEKIRRDVRITTIYEGTSEILEMTIARDRWQAAPQDPRRATTSTLAAELEALHAAPPDRRRRRRRPGAESAGRGPRGLPGRPADPQPARAAPPGRADRPRRGGSGAGRRRARPRPKDGCIEKADRRFDAEGLAAISRVFAREAALEGRRGGRALGLRRSRRRRRRRPRGRHPARPGPRRPGRTDRRHGRGRRRRSTTAPPPDPTQAHTT